MSSILIFKTASATMAAGSDCESMDSSCTTGAVARMPNQFTNIRHIPYLDHNYGQPPPMTPPDSNSPAPDDIDTGNEDEDDDGITRCICGYNHDDGYMICCDECSVWQHIECMGISSNAVPENYLCEKCQPREIDKDRAKSIQARKREEMSDDDDEDEECDSDGEKDVQSYTAISNTPTRITLTAKITQQKRKRTRSKGKFEDHKKKVRRKKHQRQKTTETFVPSIDEETNEPWEVSSNYGNIDRYEEIKENVYSKELDEIDLNWKENDVGSCTVDINEPLCKVVEVQGNRKGIVTTEDMNKNQFIIEFKGKLMLQCKFESENPFFRRCSPYVLYYSKLDHLGLCVDARKQGNDARFVRRSCSPNAQVKHFIHKGTVHLGIYSLFPLPKGAEITIAFEFPLEDYDSYLECACAQDTCFVAKYNTKYHESQTEANAARRLRTRTNDDSNSGHQTKMSPLRSVGSHSNQGDSDSDAENNPDRSLPQSGSRRKKMTREERKLEAYLKQIEKMEKKEKRNKDKEHHKQIHRTSSDDTPVEIKQSKLSVSKRHGSKRRLNAGTPANPKTKRARLSSGSSEPLSPEEHSSSASTPTTPKVTSSIPEEEGGNTPCASPNRSFKFPKNNSRVSCDEEFTETIIKPVKPESGEQSSVSSPSSPITPVEGEMDGTQVLSAASSTPDLTVDDTVNDSSNISTPKMLDIHSAGPDITSLKKQLVEMSSSISVETDSLSPCSSTSGSPTCAVSVMNSCNGPLTITDFNAGSPNSSRHHPVPAPGSPVASVIYGTKLSRTNPLYGSLKKRWLLRFFCGKNIVSDHLPNGFKSKVNGASLCATFRRKPPPVRQTVDPMLRSMPLKKRHLKKYQLSIDETTRTLPQDSQDNSSTPVKKPAGSGLLMYSPITPENKCFHESVIHSGKLDIGQMDHVLAREQLISTREPKSLKLNFDKSSMLKQFERQSISGQTKSSLERSELNTALRIDTSLTMLTADHSTHCRPCDPRLSVTSPEGMHLTSPSDSREIGSGMQESHLGSIHHSVIAHSSTDSPTGTPGKKKVSLLEYRNRSRQRLSTDSPKSSTCSSHSPVSPSSGMLITSLSLPAHPSVPIKSSLSNSMPNLLAPSKYTVRKDTARSGVDSNGPLFEPVSPDEEIRSGTLATKREGQFSRMEGNLNYKREIQRRHVDFISKKEEGRSLLNERLGAFIHETLKKDINSPASNTSSSNDSPAPPPPPPPPDVPGDAMEIEDDDSNIGSCKIYVNTPVVSSAAHQLRVPTPVQPPAHAHPPSHSQRQLQPLPQIQVQTQLSAQPQLSPQPRGPLLGAYPAPQQRPVIATQAPVDYAIAAHSIQPSHGHQGPRPLYQPQPYLVTSPPGSNPSLVRFPYQSSGQATGFFPQ